MPSTIDELEPSKAWWTSKTIWASIAQVGVGIAVSLGVFDPATGSEIATRFPEIMVGLTTSILGALSFWGRYVATKAIKASVTGS
jgi:hypothetical protein